MVYDIDGNEICAGWSLSSFRNPTTGTSYTVLRIFQTKTDGTKQFPFVFAPNGTGAATQSTLEMNTQRGFLFAVNAGIFAMPSSGLYTPVGTIIQNSQVIQQGVLADMTDFQKNLMLITIDSNGNLFYAAPDANASTLIQNGIVSAVHSFVPIVIDYEDAYSITQNSYLLNDSDAQRQIFGQYGNGDYCVITCEGRGFDNSTGFTMPQVREMCLDMGLKFAFNLDGGGSSQTVLGKKQINMIYEGTYGRKVPTYIVFNGTTQYGLPT